MVVKIKATFGQFLILVPLFAVLSTTFIVNYNLGNGIVSGKYFWFYLSIGVCAAISTMLIIKNCRIIYFSPADYLILLFGMLTLSVSFWMNNSEETTKHTLLVLVLIFYFYSKVTFCLQKSSSYWMVLGLLFAGLIESIWGLRQLYGFDYSQHAQFKLTGSFFNPGPYACYLAVILPVAFYYILRNLACYQIIFKLRYWQVYLRWGISILTFAGSILVLPAAMSRASWLAGIGGCGVVLIFYILQSQKLKEYYQLHKKKCLSVLCGFFLLLFIGCIGMYYLKKDSADGRALIWKISVQTILHHPMGVGIGNFSGSYGNEQAAYFASGRGTEQGQYVAGNPEYAFNEYLQICVEQGIIPFLLFMVIIVYSLYVGIKQKKAPAVASLVALLIVGAMSYPFSVLPFLIVLAFLLAWIHSGEKGKPLVPQLASVFAFVSLLIVLLCLYNRYPTYQAYKKWNKYTLLYHSGMYLEAVENYRQIYPLLSDQLPFLFEYAQSLSKSEMYAESNRVLEKAVRISCDPMLYNVMGKNYQALKRFDKAEQCFEKSSHIVPNRIYPYYLMALLYMETGETEKAKATAQTVLTKEPKVQSTAVREMRAKMKEILNDCFK